MRSGNIVLSYDTQSGEYISERVLFFDDRHPVGSGSHIEACAKLGHLPSLYTINIGLIEFLFLQVYSESRAVTGGV